MAVQCRACGGVYAPILPDGLRYFHACPPLSAHELAAAVAAGTVVLPKGETPDQAVHRRTYPRPGARDENIDRAKATAARDDRGTRTVGVNDEAMMKAPGAGVLEVADAGAGTAVP
jgi:hypothetical protein